VEVPEDFQVEYHRLDLFGKCSICQQSSVGRGAH
jgi:hypothetical protein